VAVQHQLEAVYRERFPTEQAGMDDARGFAWSLGCGVRDFYHRLGDAIEKGEPVSAADWADLKARAREQWPEDVIKGCQFGFQHPEMSWSTPRRGIISRLLDRLLGPHRRM